MFACEQKGAYSSVEKIEELKEVFAVGVVELSLYNV